MRKSPITNFGYYAKTFNYLFFGKLRKSRTLCFGVFFILMFFGTHDSMGKTDVVEDNKGWDFCEDHEPPVIECQDPVRVDYPLPDGDIFEALGLIPTATDNLDTHVEIIQVGDDVIIPIEGQCAANFNIRRRWQAVDDCGNRSSICAQVIRIRDLSAPVITCPVALTLDNGPGLDTSPEATGMATAVDNTGFNPVISFADTVIYVGDTLCGNFNIRRIWTAADSCGRSSRCVQVIRVRDLTSPEITSCPESVTVDNGPGLDTSPEVLGMATAIDNVDPSPMISFADTTISVGDSICGHYNIRRVWTATDVCGRVSRCVQVIRVRDLTSPEITCPERVMLENSPELDTSPEALGMATAIDAVDPNPMISYEDTIVNVGDSSCIDYNIRRRWSATDACGRVARCVQVIRVRDRTAPEITCPTDLTLTAVAGQNLSPDSLMSFATAIDLSDSVDSIEILFSDSVLIGDCAGQFTITRTWTATDLCGNTSSCEQIITVLDTIPPEITSPPHITLPAIPGQDLSPEALMSFATAVDLFDPVDSLEIAFSDSTLVGDCPGQFTIARVWTATDLCGNTSSCKQMVTVLDTMAPEISCPEDLTIEAVADQDLSPDALMSFATAVDLFDPADSLEIAFSDSLVAGDCPGQFTIIRTWTATDLCGNESSCVQEISVSDTTAPELYCPQTVDFEPSEDVDLQDLSVTGNAIAFDNFDSEPVISFSDRTVEQACGNVRIVRTFTAIDSCGNSSSCIQLIRVRDRTRPVITCPESVTLENLPELDTSPEALGIATATDNFDLNPTVTSADTIISVGDEGCSNYNIRRVWTAVDACGNTSRCNQIIRVRDRTAPEISCPISLTLEDSPGLDTSVEALGMATAIDLVDPNPTISFADTVIYVGDERCGNFNIRRLWTAMDACGRTSRCAQVIRVRDTSSPDISCPLNTTLVWEPELDTSPDALGFATALDNRDTMPVITFADTIIYVNGEECGSFNIRRRWTATDACGRFARCTQLIRVRDNAGNCGQGISEASARVQENATEIDDVTKIQGLEASIIAYPNPFKASSTISIELVEEVKRLVIDVYTVHGMLVKRLYDGKAEANQVHQEVFDASGLPAGLYFYSISLDGEISTGKVMYVKE